jgi:hypothetical protein
MPQEIQSEAQTVKRDPLRWLFVAHFADGSTIEQTQEDKCLTRADGTGSAFTDVLAREESIALTAFELRLVGSAESVVVDLTTGNFIANGLPVCAHNQSFEPQRYKLKLIYFRETRVERDLNGAGKAVADRHFVNRYFIGWETVVNGKSKQATLAVG